MAETQPEQQKTSRWSPEFFLQAFKELVTAILGVAVVLYTLSLANQVFDSLSGEAAFDQAKVGAAKDILLLVLGLTGVVIGYYFGRVPADARAAQAQQSADAATNQKELVSAEAAAVADEINDVLSTSGTAVADALSRGVAPPADALDTNKLREVRDRLRRVASAGGH